MGWKEDFRMSYELTEAQDHASRYIHSTLCPGDKKYRLGGHSKGGTLAVYAALTCYPEQKERIMEIWNNDGPGLCPDIVNLYSYDTIKGRIRRIVPEYDVFGSLFQKEAPYKIVKSTAEGLAQHDGLTWEVKNDSFLKAEISEEKYAPLGKSLDAWVGRVSLEERKAFTDDFFSALSPRLLIAPGELWKDKKEIRRRLLRFLLTSKGSAKAAIKKLFWKK